MILFLQAVPLLVLVALLGSGRAGPVVACLVAIMLCLPVVLVQQDLAMLPGFLMASIGEGAWLALVPIGIVAAGLVFHGAVMGSATERAPSGDTAERLFVATFLLGPFAETVTGFGVGAVFAIGVMRQAGIRGVPAAAMAVLTQVLIPWGGLGPGTAVGAALSGVAGQDLASRNAWIVAGELPFLLMLFWRWSAMAGHPVAMRRRPVQLAWVLAMGAALVLWHRVAPWELCGVLAAGPLLALRLLLDNPPRGVADWWRAGRAAMPYLVLTVVLLGSRLWPEPPFVQPFAALPLLAANHAVVGIIIVALLVVLMTKQPGAVLGAALVRVRRPALTLLLFVLLSRFLSNAGIPQALAGALAGELGAGAPYASPLLAGIAAFFAGTNVGSNSTMMPLQAELGRLAGLDAAVLPAVQNGTLFLLLSPQITGMVTGLAGGGVTPAAIWRLAWPVFVLSLAAGLAAVAIG